jgi:hypothetical protein
MRALAASCVSDDTFLKRSRDRRDADAGLASDVDGRGDRATSDADAACGSVDGRGTSDEAARSETDERHCDDARSTWWLRRGSLGGRAAAGPAFLSLRVQRRGLMGIVGRRVARGC